MIKVFKYKIDPYEPFIDLPVGAEVLSVDFQVIQHCAAMFLWALVDTNAEIEQRRFEYFPTGGEIPYQMGIDYVFVGTAHMDNGLVFHVFESI